VLPAASASYPDPQEAEDFVLHDFRFGTGETAAGAEAPLPDDRHPVRDAQGVTRNAVLILHGTTGSGGNFISDTFAGKLFGPGQLLDAAGTSSSCRTASAMAGRASRATERTLRFPRLTRTTTW